MAFTDASPRHDEGRFTGVHALLCLLGFFGVIFAVNGVFLHAALTSFPGEDQPKSYLQGLEYNATLDARRAQASLGWGAQVGLAETGDLVARIRDDRDAPVGGLAVSAELRHAASADLDRALALESRAPGEYAAALDRVEPGVWTAVIVATRLGDEAPVFEARKRLVVK